MTPPAISEIGIGRCGEALAGRPPRAATAHLPLVVLTLVAALFAGCASRSPTPAPVEDRAPARTPPPVGPIGTIPRAPERPEFYTVRAGDSIYSIAVSQGVDYRDLMAMNNIVDASRLSPGQVLRLRPAQAAATPAPPPPPAEPPVQVNPIPSTAPIEVRPLPAPTSIPPAPIGQKPEPPRTEAPRPDGSAPAIPAGVRGEPRAYKLPYSDENVAMIQRGGAVGGQAAVPAPPARVEPPRIDPKADAPKPQVEAKVDPRPPAANGEDRDRIDWAWPTPGRVAERFEGNNKGVGITGKVGEPVAAAAGGRVVYSGSGLRGYGQLIIIKHNDTYLSAYAHNSKILVKEGQTVTKGQKIAEIGSTDADRPKLHFEIRKNGKPVDPLGYLPERT